MSALIPAELKSVTRKFYEQILLCKPQDVISFAIQYYSDEKASSPNTNHSLHALLFLLRDPQEFRSAIGNVYCAELSNSKTQGGKVDSEGTSGIKAEEGGGPTSDTSAKKDDVQGPKDTGGNLDNNGTAVAEGNAGDRLNSRDGSRPGSGNTDGIKSVSADNNGKEDSDANKDSTVINNAVEEPAHEKFVAENANTILNNLAKGSIRAACDIPVPNSASPDTAKQGQGDKNKKQDSQEWMLDVVEEVMQIAQIGDHLESINFESCVAYLRLWLSLWVIILWIKQEITQQKSNLTLKTTNSSDVTSLMKAEDESLCRQLINGLSSAVKDDVQCSTKEAFVSYVKLVTK